MLPVTKFAPLPTFAHDVAGGVTYPQGFLAAVVVNAGNANACTGKQGLADAARMRLLAANHLRLPVEQVAVSSTGRIGVHLPMAKIEPGVGAAAQALSAGASGEFATAIRTTDKHAKSGALDVQLAEGPGFGVLVG